MKTAATKNQPQTISQTETGRAASAASRNGSANSSTQTTSHTPTTLHEAILEQADGATTYAEIAARITDAYPAAWVRRQILANSDELLAMLAKKVVRQLSEHSKQRLREDAASSDDIATVDAGASRFERFGAKFLDGPIMVPHVGIKNRGDLTADDCRVIASEREDLAVANAMWATRFREWAALIDQQNVAVLRKVDGWMEVLN